MSSAIRDGEPRNLDDSFDSEESAQPTGFCATMRCLQKRGAGFLFARSSTVRAGILAV